jgi:hypothetical protein
MNLEELSTMTDNELHARASAHLENMDSEAGDDVEKQRHLSQAQFYLSELDRREQASERSDSKRIARRDFWLEITVIVLIGAELVIALMGYREGDRQIAILGKLNQSSAATAATLTAVREAQEASLETQKHTLEDIADMNNELQSESDLNLVDVLQYSGGDSEGRFVIGNRGRVTLLLWGSRFDGQAAVMQKEASSIPYGGSYTFNLSQLSKKVLGNNGDAPQRVVSFELYLKAGSGKKYIGKSSFQIARVKGNLSIYCQSIYITRKEW